MGLHKRGSYTYAILTEQEQYSQSCETQQFSTSQTATAIYNTTLKHICGQKSVTDIK